MVKFYLTRKAVQDLGDIWDYTSETWSEKLAEIYYSLLIDSCREIASKPNLEKYYEIIERNLLGIKTGEHVIFYRVLEENKIEVVRILHSMMDFKSHL